MPVTLRTHIGGLDDDTRAAVQRRAREAADHDGVEALGEQTLLDLGADGAVHLVATADDGSVVGYAQLEPRSEGDGPHLRAAELVVAPEARQRGTGTALLRGLLAAADDAGDEVRLWAHGTLPGATALADRAGLRPVRELWRMARAATPAPAPPTLPPGVAVRRFVSGADEQVLLEVNRAAFAHHPEQGRMTLADLAARQAEPWFEADDLLLAERDGTLVGFAWTKVTPTVGELYVLGVAPAAQGTGLGGALTAAALAHLATRGVPRVVLFCEADNTAATRTYDAAGFAVDRVDTQLARPPGRPGVPAVDPRVQR